MQHLANGLHRGYKWTKTPEALVSIAAMDELNQADVACSSVLDMSFYRLHYSYPQ